MSDDGLPGPRIDTGDDPVQRRAILPAWVKAMVTIAMIVATGSMLFSAVLFSENRELVNRNARAQAQDTTRALYQIAYRICARESVDRAYARWRDPEHAVKLDILDCRPNLSGRPAKVLSPPESAVFVRRFIDDELTAAEQGICPSRIEPGRIPTC